MSLYVYFCITKPVNFDPLAFCGGLSKLLLSICEVGSSIHQPEPSVDGSDINIFVNKICCHGYPEFIPRSTPGYPEFLG